MMWHRLLTILLMLSVLAGSSCCCCVLQAAASTEIAAPQIGCCCVSGNTDSCPAEPAEPPHQCPCRSSLACTAERDRAAGLSLTAAVIGHWPDPGQCLPGLLTLPDVTHARGTALLERGARRLQCLPGGAARLTALCVQLC